MLLFNGGCCSGDGDGGGYRESAEEVGKGPGGRDGEGVCCVEGVVGFLYLMHLLASSIRYPVSFIGLGVVNI